MDNAGRCIAEQIAIAQRHTVESVGNTRAATNAGDLTGRERIRRIESEAMTATRLLRCSQCQDNTRRAAKAEVYRGAESSLGQREGDRDRTCRNRVRGGCGEGRCLR